MRAHVIVCLQLRDNQSLCFHLFRVSMANHQLKHERKHHTVIVTIHANRIDVLTESFWKVCAQKSERFGTELRRL